MLGPYVSASMIGPTSGEPDLYPAFTSTCSDRRLVLTGNVDEQSTEQFVCFFFTQLDPHTLQNHPVMDKNVHGIQGFGPWGSTTRESWEHCVSG